MTCKQCGNQCNDQSRFCEKCGFALPVIHVDFCKEPSVSNDSCNTDSDTKKSEHPIIKAVEICAFIASIPLTKSVLNHLHIRKNIVGESKYYYELIVLFLLCASMLAVIGFIAAVIYGLFTSDRQLTKEASKEILGNFGFGIILVFSMISVKFFILYIIVLFSIGAIRLLKDARKKND